MAKGKSASHARATRTVSTKGFGVSANKTIHQAPAGKPANVVPGANNRKPAAVSRGMQAGTSNAAGDTC